jgi:hypothetical protein
VNPADLAVTRRLDRAVATQSAARFSVESPRRPRARTLLCPATATARPAIVDTIASVERAGAIGNVAVAIAGRWIDAGFFTWTASCCGNGVALPEPGSSLCDLVPARLTSPSGKAMFGCRTCGALYTIPRGVCRGVTTLDLHAQLSRALDAGARYEPDEAGIPRPVGGSSC